MRSNNRENIWHKIATHYNNVHWELEEDRKETTDVHTVRHGIAKRAGFTVVNLQYITHDQTMMFKIERLLYKAHECAIQNASEFEIELASKPMEMLVAHFTLCWK